MKQKDKYESTTPHFHTRHIIGMVFTLIVCIGLFAIAVYGHKTLGLFAKEDILEMMGAALIVTGSTIILAIIGIIGFILCFKCEKLKVLWLISLGAMVLSFFGSRLMTSVYNKNDAKVMEEHASYSLVVSSLDSSDEIIATIMGYNQNQGSFSGESREISNPKTITNIIKNVTFKDEVDDYDTDNITDVYALELSNDKGYSVTFYSNGLVRTSVKRENPPHDEIDYYYVNYSLEGDEETAQALISVIAIYVETI